MNGDELISAKLDDSTSGFDLSLVLWADVVMQQVIVEIGDDTTLEINLLCIGIERVIWEL